MPKKKNKHQRSLKAVKERAQRNIERARAAVYAQLPSPPKQSALEQVKANRGKVSIGSTEDGSLLFLDPSVRSMHTHILGGTGKGKSTLLEHMIRQDIRAGHGLCLLDPHGGHKDGLLNKVIRWLSESGNARGRTVHIIDPNSTENLTAFNPLELEAGVDLSVITETTLEAIEAVWHGENTLEKPRLRRIMTATIALLAENGLTLAEGGVLLNLAEGARLRNALLSVTNDPHAREVFNELADRKATEYREHVEAPLNRFSELVRPRVIRALLGQTAHTLDLRAAMDRGDIILVNLQAGIQTSTVATTLLGTLLVRYLFQRSESRKHPGRPFYLYIDECHRYLSGDIPKILDESRKHGLHTVLAHQRLGQLERAGNDIYSAVMGSTEIKIVFGGLFMDDAKVMAENIIPLQLERPVGALVAPAVVGYEIMTLRNGSKTLSRSTGTTKTQSEATTHTLGYSEGSGNASSSGESETTAPNATDATLGTSTSESSSSFATESESVATTTGRSQSMSKQESTAETDGWSETLRPILREHPSAVHGLDKELYAAAKRLQTLPIGQAFVSAGAATTVITVPWVKPARGTESIETIKNRLAASSPARLTMANAEQALHIRLRDLDRYVVERHSRTAAQRDEKEKGHDP